MLFVIMVLKFDGPVRVVSAQNLINLRESPPVAVSES